MRGLLRNNFYSLGSNLLLSLILAAVMMVIFLVIDFGSIVSMLLAVQSFIFVANAGSALKVDVESNWDKFELTMPVKRSDVINARYISFVALISFGVLSALVSVLIKSLVFGGMDIATVFFGLSYGVALSTITAALMYPLMQKFGAEKSEMIIIVCALVSAGIYLLAPYVYSYLLKDTTIMLSDPLIGVSCIVFAVVLFIMSYFISLAAYKKKEL